MVKSIAIQFGTVDILVNNAQAMRQNVFFEDTTDEDMALALQSGLMATFYFMKPAYRTSKTTASRS